MAGESKKILVLKSSDGETFEVSEAAALLSQTIKQLVDDGCADGAIPLPNVASKVLAKVIEYCTRHVGTADDDDGELKSWDAEFVKVDQATLFDLILAANYLNIKTLLDLTRQTAATFDFKTLLDLIKDKTPEQVQAAFDFTPEEEEEVRGENHWAHE